MKRGKKGDARVSTAQVDKTGAELTPYETPPSCQLCVSRLHTRFPDSPRVASLQGMLLEARGELGQALSLYDAVLAKDESSLVCATCSAAEVCWRPRLRTAITASADCREANGRSA